MVKSTYTLNPGHQWNPLRKFPRNELCFCGSRVKFKKCCLPFVPPAVTNEAVESLQELVDLALKGKRPHLTKINGQSVVIGYP